MNDHLQIGTLWALWQALSVLVLYPSDSIAISAQSTLTSKSQNVIFVDWLALGHLNPLGRRVRQDRRDWKLASSQNAHTPLSSVGI